MKESFTRLPDTTPSPASLDEQGRTRHRPLLKAATRLQPLGDPADNNGYAGYPEELRQRPGESGGMWRSRVSRQALDALLEPLRDLELTAYERSMLAAHAARDDVSEVAFWTSLFDRLYRHGERNADPS